MDNNKQFIFTNRFISGNHIYKEKCPITESVNIILYNNIYFNNLKL